MMRIAVDTNLFLRIAEPSHPMCAAAADAFREVAASPVELVTVPQTHHEFWAVATRTKKANGLELDADEAERMLDFMLSETTLLPDDGLCFRRWRRLLAKYRVRGVNSHDLRIVAALSRHGVDTMLTFNASDFRRYAEVEVVEPAGVVAWLAARL